jgi:hypothetical protein
LKTIFSEAEFFKAAALGHSTLENEGQLIYNFVSIKSIYGSRLAAVPQKFLATPPDFPKARQKQSSYGVSFWVIKFPGS